VKLALALAEHCIPIFAVRVYPVRDRWRKEPHIKDWAARATTNKATIEEWWRCWPRAMVGVPLNRIDLVIVDCDRHGGPDGVALLQAIDLPPHQAVTTMSGGEHHFFRQPDPPVWTTTWEGGEVIGRGRGNGKFVAAYALEPFIAAAPVLPPDLLERLPKAVRPSSVPQACVVVATGGLLDGLRSMDPREWNGEHDEWRDLMGACKAVGIDREDFVAWSIGDPDYRNEASHIRHEWGTLRAEHGGAFYKALSQRGIKVRKQNDEVRSVELKQTVPAVRPRAMPDPRWRNRFEGIRRWLRGHPTEADLFSAACLAAEIAPSTAAVKKLLLEDCRASGLVALLSEDGCCETIEKAFEHISGRKSND
jgi:hypothetical protein